MIFVDDVVAVVFADAAAAVLFVAVGFAAAASAHQMSCTAATDAEGTETESGLEPGYLERCDGSFAVIEAELDAESGLLTEDWIC